MITRQDIFKDLFKLKESGVDISSALKLLESQRGIPREVVEFLKDKSPQFQFYEDIHSHQKALMKNVLNYEKLNYYGKVKVGSSLLTRMMIAIEYKNLSECLLRDLKIEMLSSALDAAISRGNVSPLEEVLEMHKNAMILFCKDKGVGPGD